MYQILLIVFLVTAVSLVALILVQHGKGADMGASFGAGASNTVFGSSGSGNFLTRTTGILAAIFFAVALALGYMTANQNELSANSESDIAGQISSELGSEVVAPTSNDTGIPTDNLDEVSVPAAESVAIPADSVEVPETQKKAAPAPKKKDDSKDGGS
jgi:preprotein translocase subunit SecG